MTGGVSRQDLTEELNSIVGIDQRYAEHGCGFSLVRRSMPTGEVIYDIKIMGNVVGGVHVGVDGRVRDIIFNQDKPSLRSLRVEKYIGQCI